jgi:hypothetical protein
MDGMLPPVVVSLVANIKQFQASMAQARGELVALETQGNASFAKFQKMSIMAGGIAAAAIVGGVALAVKAYQEDEVAQAKLQVAVNKTHQSYATLEPQLKKTAESMAKFGFEDNQATDALATLTTATGDAEKAQKLLAVSADLAAYKNMSLESAATMVARASNGSAVALTRMGLNIGDLGEKGKTAAEKLEYGNKVIAALTAQIGGQAEAKAKTFAGTMAALSATMGNFASNIGEVVMPYVQILADGLKNLADWVMANEAAVKVFIGVVAGVLVVVIANATVVLLTYAAAWIAANFQILLVVGAIGLVIAAFASGNPYIIAATVAVGLLAAAMIFLNRQIIMLHIQYGLYIARLAVLRGATIAATAAQTALGVSSYAALGPIGLLVGALALVGFGFYKMSTSAATAKDSIATVGDRTMKVAAGAFYAKGATSSYAASLRDQAIAADASSKSIEEATYFIKNHTAAALADADATWSAADAYAGYAAAQQREQASIKGSEQLYAGYLRVVKEGNKWKQEQKDKHDKAGSAATAEKDKIVALDRSMSNLINTTKRWAAGTTDLTRNLGGDLIEKFTASVKKAGAVTQATADSFVDMANQIKTRIADTLTAANAQLDEARQKFNEYRDSITGGITSGNELADAAKAQSDAIQAVADAVTAQAKAQAALNEANANATAETADKVAEAQKAYDEATTSLSDARARQKNFLGFLKVGADTAEAFAGQIDSLRTSGATLETTQQIAALGAQTGGRIISELMSGGRDAIERANELVQKVKDVAVQAGTVAAQQFYGAGVTAAQAFVDAVKATIPALQDVLNDIARMINAAGFKVAAPSLGPDASAAVAATPNAFTSARPDMFAEMLSSGYASVMGVTSPIRARANGGPVSSGQPYLVGEQGPEMFVPRMDGSITPNGAGNTINVYAQTNANAMDIAREMAWQLKVGV